MLHSDEASDEVCAVFCDSPHAIYIFQSHLLSRAQVLLLDEVFDYCEVQAGHKLEDEVFELYSFALSLL